MALMSDFQSMTNVDGVVTRLPTRGSRCWIRLFVRRSFTKSSARTMACRCSTTTLDALPNSGVADPDGTWALRSHSLPKKSAQPARPPAPELGLDVYVRYMVTRGEGPVDLFPSAELTPRYVIVVREVPKWNPEYYSTGVRVAIAGTRRNPGNALDPNIKGGNYLNNVLGVMDARAVGADDCLMLNDAGLVTEASNSNVFFVIGDKLVTPGQSAANLRGLTKAAATSLHRARPHAPSATSMRRRVHAPGLRTSATREVMPSYRCARSTAKAAIPEAAGTLPAAPRLLQDSRAVPGSHTNCRCSSVRPPIRAGLAGPRCYALVSLSPPPAAHPQLCSSTSQNSPRGWAAASTAEPCSRAVPELLLRRRVVSSVSPTQRLVGGVDVDACSRLSMPGVFRARFVRVRCAGVRDRRLRSREMFPRKQSTHPNAPPSGRVTTRPSSVAATEAAP